MTRTTAFSRLFNAVALAGSFAFTSSALFAASQGEDAPKAGPSPSPVSAMAVTPLRIELPSDTSAETVMVRNTTAAPLAVQMRLFGWSQTGGEDVYTPSSDLLVSPSIVSIPAGQTQIVRVTRKSGATAGEKRFRLVVDQLPDPARARPGTTQTRIRFVLPMFVDRDRAAPADFAWRLTDAGLELDNNGGATARIVKIAVTGPDGRVVPVEKNALRYVLGSSTIGWPIGEGCSIGPVRVTAEIDGRTVDAEPVPACG